MRATISYHAIVAPRVLLELVKRFKLGTILTPDDGQHRDDSFGHQAANSLPKSARLHEQRVSC